MPSNIQLEHFNSPQSNPKFSSPKEELDYLRRLVAEREAQAHGDFLNSLKQDEGYKAGSGNSVTSTNEQVREKVITQAVQDYKEASAPEILQDEYAIEKDILDRMKVELHDDDDRMQVMKLLGVMREKGIKNALTAAASLERPHVEDDFHRVLVQFLKQGFDSGSVIERTPLWKILQMTLYEVTLPREDDDSKNKGLKEIISAMEQIYSGLIPREGDQERLGEHFTVEIAVKNIGEQVSFFMAVPDQRRGLFEKQVLALFPKAKIEEVKEDYNIFNDDGVSLGASLIAREKRFPFTIRTYDEFDEDPFQVIQNSFSKIAYEGEGAAIQILVRTPQTSLNHRFKEVIKNLEKGETVGTASNLSTTKEVFGMAKELFFQKSDSEKEKEQKRSQSAENLKAVENVQKKIMFPIVEMEIRIVVSAPELNRAKELMSNFQAVFRQFDNPVGNYLEFENVQGKKLENLFHAFTFREKLDVPTPVNIQELTTLAHFPVRTVEGAREIKEAKANTGPAPLDIPRSGTFMGNNEHRGDTVPIYMTKDDRVRHLYTIGQTGTGKTSFLTSLIVQDIANGEGCCFIDPHGNDVQYIMSTVPKERYNDVIYFDPGYMPRPFGLNMMEFDPSKPEQKTFVVNEMLGIFNKLFDMKVAGGPAFEQYFRNSALLVMDHPESGNTLLEITRVLSDKDFRAMKLKHCKSPLIKQFWENAEKTTGEGALANYVPYITNKFDVFLSNDIMRPIVTQETSSFNMRDIMDNKKILLVNLAKGTLGDINSSLIGLILVGKILMAALSRVDSIGKTLPDFYLYIDEFQNVTTDSISTILSEARKYRLSLNIAHQFIAQLEEGIRDSIFGNVGSMAVHRVGAEDAEFLEKQFAPVFTARDIMNQDNFKYYAKFLLEGKTIKPFSVSAVKPPQGISDHLESLKQLSYMTLGRDRDEVERTMMAKYEKKQEEDPFAAFGDNPFF